MKTLHLLRHAKSSWKNTGLADYERGLNKRGRRNAPAMGQALSQIVAPMPVAASASQRALLTLAGLCAGWPALAEVPHISDEALYTFSSDVLFDWIALRDDQQDALFIIGHNPALTDLVNELVGRHCLDNLPTAGYVRLALSIDHWRDLLQGCAVLEQSLFPKQLPGA